MNVKGKVTRIFMAKESGFKILVLSVSDIQSISIEKRNPGFPDSVTLVGMMKGVEAEYVIEVSGEWENRPSGSYWPWQFKVADVMICEFETPILVRKFLSGLSCVGPELAKRILAVYPNAVEIIEKQPRKLTAIKDINEAKAMQIHTKFLEEKEKKSLNSFLGRFGVKSDDINKISSHYGSNALRIVKRNPYVLCEDRFLTFKVCDKIGKDLGFAPDSEPRLKCAMNYVLYTKAGAKGHVYLEKEMLLEETNAFFRDSAYIDTSFSAEQLEIKLHNLVANDEIICERGKYYHPERYKNELTVSETLRRRAKKGSRFADISFDLLMNCVTRAEEENGIKLDDLQREAVMMAVVNSTVVITGGPGSGKTTLLNTFIKTVEYVAESQKTAKPSISLAAPTGMASKRMSASTGRDAKTIHKLFDIRYDLFETKEEIKPILSDIVVLDEASMLDIDIMAYILRALSDSTALILIGDVDQIPSIGPGNVLTDIIDSGALPVVRLMGSYRHGSRKTILTNAIKINTGDEELVTNRSDFVLCKVPDRSADRDCRRLKAVTERVFCEEYLAGGKDPYRVQVISPLRSKTLASVDELNFALQSIANPLISDKDQVEFGKVMFRRGDKVMQVSNNYEKGVYNGDVGLIKEVSAEKKKLLVNFQGLQVDYYESEFEQLKHAFATTVHKVQGSQYPVVIMVVTNYHSMMLLRNLLYTGVTRAQQRLIIVGDEDAVRYAIRNCKNNRRLSALSERLKKAG